MAHEKNHDFHILPPSVWPLTGAFGAFVMLFGAVLWMSPQLSSNTPWVFLVGLVVVLYTMYAWWADVTNEGETGDHTPVVRIGLRYGFIMFIMSEVMFFSAWFWAFFKNALYPMSEQSPMVDAPTHLPDGIHAVNYLELPLVNTLLLLLSGCAATWAHHAIAHDNNRKDLVTGLVVAVIFGAIFTCVQAYEYWHLIAEAGWAFSGDIYFGAFFMATGFHGFHVLIGSIFLLVCLIRARRGHFTQEQHVGFEAAAWYWHFVDVVWLFLFAAVYIWGAYQ